MAKPACADAWRRRPWGRIFCSRPKRFTLWLPLPAGWSRAAFQARLSVHDLSVAPSDAFAVGGPAPEAVRIGLGAPGTRADLAGALAAIAQVLGRQPAWGAYA